MEVAVKKKNIVGPFQQWAQVYESASESKRKQMIRDYLEQLTPEEKAKRELQKYRAEVIYQIRFYMAKPCFSSAKTLLEKLNERPEGDKILFNHFRLHRFDPVCCLPDQIRKEKFLPGLVVRLGTLSGSGRRFSSLNQVGPLFDRHTGILYSSRIQYFFLLQKSRLFGFLGLLK